MLVVKGKDPTKLYAQLWSEVMSDGDDVYPRGKHIKEIRPVCVEFTNPLNRVTFVPGRRINPFFQVAESFWILAGRADVSWPVLFNSGIKQFSDDGEWFNAPYGERLRSWNANALHNIIINPKDQLADVLEKFKADKDTRQAVAVLYNPMFDNVKYTVGEKGRDIACNLILTFKIRNNKLNLTVFNRSNDLHWGLFGANLCQFSTILEQMTSWLGAWYPELEVGTYTHITDSLHVYLEDYGANSIPADPPSEVYSFQFTTEPRMFQTFDQTTDFIEEFNCGTDPLFSYIANSNNPYPDFDVIKYLDTECDDPYWNFVFKALYAYVLVKRGDITKGLEIMRLLPCCQWKVSMLHFLKNFISKALKEQPDIDETYIKTLYCTQVDELVVSEQQNSDALKTYLKLF